MRSPEAARAIPDLVAGGVLSPERAAPLLAAARGEIVTVRAELRALLGLAVTLATAGAGLLVREYREVLGPTTVAALLGAATALALVVLFRREPRFDWGRIAAPDWTSDGLVLLAIGLAGAELAWIEVHFTPLGADWPLHLLVMSLLSGALAVRFDSIPAWSLALSTFAAWRGVALAPAAALDSALGSGVARFRFELLLVATVFFALGRGAERTGRKSHFEPATTFLALAAAATGLATGLVEGGAWPLWALALAALGVLAAAWAFRRRRRALFALASLSAYAALTRGLFALPFAEMFGCFWFAFSTVGAIALLVLVHRRFRDEEAA